MNIQDTEVPKRFRHELVWYCYIYNPVTRKVGIYHTLGELLKLADCRCKRVFMTREEVLAEIKEEKWNTFLLPILQEAIKYFPKETKS